MLSAQLDHDKQHSASTRELKIGTIIIITTSVITTIITISIISAANFLPDDYHYYDLCTVTKIHLGILSLLLRVTTDANAGVWDLRFIVPLSIKNMVCTYIYIYIYGVFTKIYPKPNSFYLRGTIGSKHRISARCRGSPVITLSATTPTHPCPGYLIIYPTKPALRWV